jgi:adenine deaminase
MIIQCPDRKKLADAAMGRIPCDRILFNANIVNGFTGSLRRGEVWIVDGFIAHVVYHEEPTVIGQAKTLTDLNGRTLIPGLIDAHVHIESSLLTPRRFAEAVLVHGTTTVITDPHEIANVAGMEGITYMHDAAADLPLRVMVDVPSSVPSVVGLENAGASLSPLDVEKAFDLPRVLGLAEVMDAVGLVHGEARINAIVDVAHRHQRRIQGHAPMIRGAALSAYRSAGPFSDHEATSAEEALEKISAGLFIYARHSSISPDLPEMAKLIKQLTYKDRVCLCTDDMEAQDMVNHGHLDDAINVLVNEGVNVIDAIRMATLHTAQAIGEPWLGVIAAGGVADLVVVKELHPLMVDQVIVGGLDVVRDGQLIQPVPARHWLLEHRNTMVLDHVSEACFTVTTPISQGHLLVNVMAYDSLTALSTHLEVTSMGVNANRLVLDDPAVHYVAVINRYGLNTQAVHVVKNTGLLRGAFASTVSHDSHNLVVVYRDPVEAVMAANAVIDQHGGMAAVLDRHMISALALPVGGLMADVPAQVMAQSSQAMKAALRELGITHPDNPLLRLAMIALPVIPHVKMTDLGCVDTDTQTFIPLFAKEKP